MRVKSLTIQNFKSFRDKTVSFADKTEISGRNTSGKTTVFDAFTWLLFGKDSLGNTQFEVRPLDADGNKIHNVEIGVTGTIEHDGVEHTLSRTQVENWVKRRGTTESMLQGNVNKYEVDGYPRNESEYKQYIESICDEKLFRLLTSPMAFTSLPWKEQRAILMQFAAPATDAEMARGFGGYEEIIGELEIADTDLILKKYAQKLKLLKQEQVELPVRIDEQEGSRVNADIAELALHKSGIESSIADTEEKMSAYTDRVKERADLASEKARLETELGRLSSRIEGELYEKKRELDREIMNAEMQIDLLNRSSENAERELITLRESIKSMEAVNAALAQKMGEPGRCPTCGQALNADAISRRDEAVKERISKNTAEITAQKKRISDADKAIKKAETEIKNWDKKIDECKKSLDRIPSVSVAVERDAQYKMLSEQLTDVIDRMTALNRSDDGQYDALKNLLDGLRKGLDEVNAEIVRAEQNTEIDERVEALRQRQMEVGDMVIAIEHKRDLVEQFLKQKMDTVSAVINDQFDGVKFKLFDVQLNGGIAPTCECTVDGVPFGSLNNGARITSGMKIIRTLQRHYGVSVPVFVDNAEAISTGFMPDMDCQLILLKVTDEKELTIK